MSSFLSIPLVSNSRYVALPSGGARGIATPGGLQACKELCGIDFGIDVWTNVEQSKESKESKEGKKERRLLGVSGTSIGAMHALMLAVGYSVEELWRFTLDARFTDFVRLDPTQLFSQHALDSGATLRATLSGILQKKLGVSDLTLFELRQRTHVDLVVVAADATTASVRYLRADTEPSMSVVQAVYASMALAPLLPPLEYHGHLLQDGGGVDSIPTSVWEDKPAPTLSFALHWTRDIADDTERETRERERKDTELKTDAKSEATDVRTGPPTTTSTDAKTSAKEETEKCQESELESESDDIGIAHQKRTARQRRPGNVLAYLSRTLYCALYPSKIVQWCLMSPRARATCIVLDTSDVATVDLQLSHELKERARSKGYQDAAAALFLMADGKPPRRGAQRFAKTDGLPKYVHALLQTAQASDTEFFRTMHAQGVISVASIGKDAEIETKNENNITRKACSQTRV